MAILKKMIKSNHVGSAEGLAQNLKWDFPSTGHGEDNGFSDALLEYFQGDHEKFIARETIQNAVDARADYNKPVQVVFECLSVPAADLPECRMLEDTISRCVKYVKGQEKAEEFFKVAIKMLKGSLIPILKISDFNTNGLFGPDDDRNGNWYRLVRATGTSTSKGVGGGSFGIGKGAPIAASLLRTVFYSSINKDGDAVFQGKARLVSHCNDYNDVRQGVGFFGINGYQAVRDKKTIPELYRREEKGTDIFVMGYKTDSDWQKKIIRSVLNNFWLAIMEGSLEVIIRDSGDKIITKESLARYLDEYEAEEAKCFFESVDKWTNKFEKDLKYLGKVQLFVKKQDGYPRRVMMTRKPKMLVTEKPYRVLRDPYAGVFICEDDKGNNLLRDLEPPAHNEWDKDRAPQGMAALRELDTWIKDMLRSMGDAITSEPEDIPGLDRYLPDSEESDYIPDQGQAPLNQTDLSSEEESGREIGATLETQEAEVESVLKRTAIVKSPGSGQGPGRGKRNEGEGGNSEGTSGGNEEGEGSGVCIRTADISFRSFVQKTNRGQEYHFIITGRENCQGAVRLVAVGDDGNYPVEVASAIDLKSKKKYEVSGPMIKGLAIGSGETVKLAVKLESNKKYALGIENYEG